MPFGMEIILSIVQICIENYNKIITHKPRLKGNYFLKILLKCLVQILIAYLEKWFVMFDDK